MDILESVLRAHDHDLPLFAKKGKQQGEFFFSLVLVGTEYLGPRYIGPPWCMYLKDVLVVDKASRKSFDRVLVQL